MAKVLLINPVVRMEDNPKHVPYGIALMAAVADKEGHQVQVFDANAWRTDDETIKDILRNVLRCLVGKQLRKGLG